MRSNPEAQLDYLLYKMDELETRMQKLAQDIERNTRATQNALEDFKRLQQSRR